MLRIFAISAIALGASATDATLASAQTDIAQADLGLEQVDLSESVASTMEFGGRRRRRRRRYVNPFTAVEKSAKTAAAAVAKAAAEAAAAAAAKAAAALAVERKHKVAVAAAVATAERNTKDAVEKAAKKVAKEAVEKVAAAERHTKDVAEKVTKDLAEKSAKAERVAKDIAERAKVAAEKVAKTAEKAAKVRHCVSSWAGWTSCTKKCGTGSQTNTLVISQQSRFGGTTCPTKTSDSRPCNTAPCPVNGGWSAFGAWSDCSKSCDGGTTTQIRKCDSPKPAFGGDDCAGSAKSTKSCNSHTCFCPSCKYINGRMSVFHETLHEQHEGRVHGPRTVHKNCAAGSKAGACTKSYVMAHSCHFNPETGCKCVCKKPDVSQDRNQFEIPEKMNPQDLTNYIRSHNIV